MKILLDDDTYMTTALGLADKGEYFDALCIFARVDCYESMLNQIGCLCKLKNIGYANELYRILLSRYHFTHNCYSDLCSLGDAVEDVRYYFGNIAKGSLAQRSPNRANADEKLLGYYSADGGDYDFDAEDFLSDAVFDADDDGDAHESVFFDINSPQYFNNLRMRMDKAYMRGNYGEGKRLQREYMSIDTDYLPTLEMQLFVCVTEQNWQQGLPLALKLCDHDDATFRGIGASILVLSHADGQYLPQLKLQLQRIARFGEDVADCDMSDYLQICCNNFGYCQESMTLCDILFGHYKDAGCDALRLCGLVYFNAQLYDKARQAALLLLRAVPWNVFSRMLLMFINNRMAVKLELPCGANALARFFDVPVAFAALSEYMLLESAEKKGSLSSLEQLNYLQCIADVCRGCIVTGHTEHFVNEAALLETLLSQTDVNDADAFENFAKRQLCAPVPVPTLNRQLLSVFIQSGYHGKLLVGLAFGYYVLDLSEAGNDPIFASALTVCATVRKVDAKRLAKCYETLSHTVQLPQRIDVFAIRSLAYCLLAMAYKGFTDSEESSFFSDGENQLYKQYLAATAND